MPSRVKDGELDNAKSAPSVGGRGGVQKSFLSKTNVSADGFYAPFLSAGVMARRALCVPKEKCSPGAVIFATPACDRENYIHF